MIYRLVPLICLLVLVFITVLFAQIQVYEDRQSKIQGFKEKEVLNLMILQSYYRLTFRCFIHLQIKNDYFAMFLLLMNPNINE